MPISIEVRSQRQQLIATLRDVSESIPRVPESLSAADLPTDRDRFPMLGYLDPFGNTIFNQLQALEVVEELTRLAQAHPDNADASARARAVRVLVAAHMRRPHTYLWFLGD